MTSPRRYGCFLAYPLGIFRPRNVAAIFVNSSLDRGRGRRGARFMNRHDEYGGSLYRSRCTMASVSLVWSSECGGMRDFLDNTRESVSEPILENRRDSQLCFCVERLTNPGIQISLKSGGLLCSLISPESLCLFLPVTPFVQVFIRHELRSL